MQSVLIVPSNKEVSEYTELIIKTLKVFLKLLSQVVSVDPAIPLTAIFDGQILLDPALLSDTLMYLF